MGLGQSHKKRFNYCNGLATKGKSGVVWFPVPTEESSMARGLRCVRSPEIS